MARPNHIDLGPRALLDPNRTGTPSPNELSSPRSGDVPPALSPLDAFALQSRLLAKKLEDSHLDGNRLSRLPPQTIATELAKSRNGFFNSLSAGSANTDELKVDEADHGTEKGTIAQPPFRPMSLYPSIIQAPLDDDRPESAWAVRENTQDPVPLHEQWRGLQEGVEPLVNRDYFSQARSGSPEPYIKRDPAQTVPFTKPWMNPKGRPPPLEPRKQPTNESLRSTDWNMLLPPRSPAFSRSSGGPSSIRSVQMDSGDDSDHSYRADHHERSLQSGCSPLRSRSPFSPVFAPPRSPSMSSDHSFNAVRLPRQSQNFSRPLSRTGKPIVQRPSLESVPPQKDDNDQVRPSFDVLSLQESIGSPGFAPPIFSESSEARPSEEEPAAPSIDSEVGPQPAASYIYTKYSLPRGRIVSRDSMIIPDYPTYIFQWEPPISDTDVTPTAGPPPGSSVLILPVVTTESSTAPTIDQSSSLAPIVAPIPQHARSRSADGTSSTTSMRTITAPAIPEPPTTSTSFSFAIERPRSSTPTASGRTKPTIPTTKTAFFAPINKLRADTLSPEEHLAEGISCHQEGALQKSTYHLRVAANAGLPTGMLLYALACRHGWGMRPNASEGVKWLRKAVDSAGLEVAYDEESVAAAQQRKSSATGAPPAVADFTARRAHKAQFALSIYELGVSYMNGWGIAQDRALALRCFEIAGAWGDGDALAEAGFCYAKGVGCKKDLRRAAWLYRRAEAKGVEMAGNSWIYKDKYRTPPGTSSSNFFSNPFASTSTAAATVAGAGATSTLDSPTTSSNPFSSVGASGGRRSRKSRDKERDKERDREKEDREREKKGREKSRTRTLFGGRKRSTTLGASGDAGDV